MPSFDQGLSGSIPLDTEHTRPSHIPTAEGKLILRCLCKAGTALQSKTGNQLSSWDDMSCMEHSLSCCIEINIHIELRLVSQEISVVS